MSENCDLSLRGHSTSSCYYSPHPSLLSVSSGDRSSVEKRVRTVHVVGLFEVVCVACYNQFTYLEWIIHFMGINCET